MGRKIPMYKAIDSDILFAFEEKVPRGQRTKVLEELMEKHSNE